MSMASAISLLFQLVPISMSLVALSLTRSLPIDRPSSSSSTFRFNFLTSSWDRSLPMLSHEFCSSWQFDSDQILVAGGGSRHTMFGAAGMKREKIKRDFCDFRPQKS
ncbi:F-box/kelch-repeat protein OR23 [Camellia lanceoleosa]|uniref:F-box/kelch-repeat protein OR23 n=1 Tax=Camellia lanceoleosa TaxID=1840588 RepID=A0ACC0H1Q4_9ERIC|nr:F-box/kelch-repeat protein OR23 [Camellia lanceoleosa]